MRATAFCAMAFLICASMSYAEQNAADSLSEIKQGLESADLGARVRAMRQLAMDGPEKYGADSLDLIKQGIRDDSDVVQEYAIYSLRRYSWSGVSKIRDSELARKVLGILSDHPNSDVAVEAANAYGFIYGITSEFEQTVIGRAEREKDPVVLNQLFDVLRESGIQRGSSEEVLLQVLRGTPSEAAITAAQVAANSDISTAFLVTEVIRLVQADATFAHPTLMDILRQNAEEAQKYLPELYEVERRFAVEVKKDLFARNVTIYNDEFYRESLDLTISLLEAASAGGQLKNRGKANF